MIQNSHGCHGYCKRNFAFLTAKGFFRVTEPVSFRDPPISKGGASQKDVRPSREVGTPAPFRYRPGLVSIRAKKKAEHRCDAPPLDSPAASYSPVWRPRSTIGAGGLNCRVRDGNGCFTSAMATGNFAHWGGRQGRLLRR